MAGSKFRSNDNLLLACGGIMRSRQKNIFVINISGCYINFRSSSVSDGRGQMVILTRKAEHVIGCE